MHCCGCLRVSVAACAGVTAGAAAGVPVVGMLTSQTEERLRKAGAMHCVRNYRELLALAQDAQQPALQAA